MWQYRTFHLDPDSDIDAAVAAYERQGWQVGAAGVRSAPSTGGACTS